MQKTPKFEESGSYYPIYKNNSSHSEEIKILSWNIERGYKLKEIIELLKLFDADILLLQEVDYNCKRTDSKAIVVEIARELHLGYYFAVEFEEIDHHIRSAKLAGGGVHGNAILSKYPIENTFRHEHKFQFYDWEKMGIYAKQPRRGGRIAAFGTVITEFGKIQCVSCHLENMCGMEARKQQTIEILDILDSNSIKDSSIKAQVIAGDMNTLMHGLARFNPFISDPLRFSTFGQSEAEWFVENVFKYVPQNIQDVPKIEDSTHSLISGEKCLGFYDPFDKSKDVTIPTQMFGLWCGKLDWILMRGLNCFDKQICGQGLSDHHCLTVQTKIS